MAVQQKELAILEQFGFEISPVGVKFLSQAPTDMKRLEEKMTLCEMLKKAQEGSAFYAGASDHTCDAATYALGQSDGEKQFLNGEFGAGMQIFRDTRAASRLYHSIPVIRRNVINFLALAPLDKMEFDPDLMIIFARTAQAEIMLRAMSYRNGQAWTSRYSAAIGCAWMFVQPYLSGEINYGIAGLGFGMKRRKLFPEGLNWMSVPFTVLPEFLDTLREVPWVPEPYKPDGLEFVKQLKIRLGLE